MQLADLLAEDGGCELHREEGGEESQLFLSHFDAFASQPGGSSAGWRRTAAPPPATRSSRVGAGKGCLGELRTLPPAERLLDDGGAFVLDAPAAKGGGGGGSEVFQWLGMDAPLKEKALAMLVAHTVRSCDRNGACATTVLPATSDADPAMRASVALPATAHDFLRFGAALRADEPPHVPPAAPPRLLYKFELAGHSAVAGTPKLRLSVARVKEGALCSSALEAACAVVLDCEREVFVWGGVRAEGYVRWAAGALGRRLLEERHGAAELMREGSGCEGALFRSKFARWHWLREANPALYEGAAAHQAMRDRAWRDGGALDPEAEVAAMRRECDRARLRWQRQLGGGADDVDPTTPARGRRGVERTTSEEGEAPGEATPAAVVAAGAAAGLDIDEGSEMLNVWLVTADSTTLLGEAERGVFWSGACYMCLYSYTHGGVERTLLYFWKGRDVSALNFLTWRFQLQQLLDEAVAAGTIPIMCSQDEEPDRFIALMEGMVVLTGRHPGGVDGRLSGADGGDGGDGDGDDESNGGLSLMGPSSLSKLRGVLLLQVKRYVAAELGVCARQVPARPEYLESADVFVLLHTARAALFVWRGKHAPASLVAAAKALADRFCAAQPLKLSEVSEESEGKPFWDAMCEAMRETSADGAAAAASDFASAAGELHLGAEGRLSGARDRAKAWRGGQGGGTR